MSEPAWVEPMPDELRTALARKGDPDAIVRTLREAGFDVVPSGTVKRLRAFVVAYDLWRNASVRDDADATSDLGAARQRLTRSDLGIEPSIRDLAAAVLRQGPPMDPTP